MNKSVSELVQMLHYYYYFLFRSSEFLVGTKKRRDMLKADIYSKLLFIMAVYNVHTIEIFNVYLF